jgi:protein TonB
LKPIGPAEFAALQEALRSPSAETRGVAARVARVQGTGGLVPALREAVSTEPDALAAEEEMLALGWLAGTTEQDALFAAAGRFDGSLDDTLVVSLAMRGPAAFEIASRLKQAAVKPRSWARYFEWATSGGREGLLEADLAANLLGVPEASLALREPGSDGRFQDARLEPYRLRDKQIRTLWDLPAGVMPDVLASTGCRLKSDPQWAAAEATFDKDARLQQIGFYPMTGVSAECQAAARTLLLMSVLPGERPPQPGMRDLIVLPLWKGFAECLDPAPRNAARSKTAGSSATTRPPQIDRQVPPRYPNAALNEKRTGVVLVEALVSSTGCISGARVLASEHVDLAGEALRSVVQWRFKPALRDGKPEATIVHIPLSFRIY